MYGIQHGATTFQGNQHSEVKPQNAVSPTFTQEDLAAKLGMSVDTLQNYKALADMIPELDDMVRDGKDISNFGFNWETVYQLKRSGCRSNRTCRCKNCQHEENKRIKREYKRKNSAK